MTNNIFTISETKKMIYLSHPAVLFIAKQENAMDFLQRPLTASDINSFVINAMKFNQITPKTRLYIFDYFLGLTNKRKKILPHDIKKLLNSAIFECQYMIDNACNYPMEWNFESKKYEQIKDN